MDAFVSLLWFCEGYIAPHAKDRLLPTGSMSLVMNLAEDRTRVYDTCDPGKMCEFGSSVLVGAHSQFFIIDTAEQFATAGVQFKPGGTFPFFKAPAGALANQHVSLDALWGRFAGELREQVLEARTPAQKVRVLQQALLARLAKALAGHAAVAFAVREIGNDPLLSVSEISGRVGLSRRRFTQLFQDQVGLSPKTFCRVRRFQRALDRVRAKPASIDWADLALECGYYDQAHFIHDFGTFSGLTPSSYLARLPGTNGNHVPLID